MKRLLACLFCFAFLFTAVKVPAQDLKNGGVEGIPAYGGFNCPSWTNVPFGDKTCTATGSSWATPDVLDATGPGAAHHMAGTPHSGKTFASGIHGFIIGDMFQEGIMQEVSGFIPGNQYKIIFYQAVIKQDNLLDTSGCWAVYLDNTLAEVSAPTISTLQPADLHTKWERREISFIAAKAKCWIKILPMDDDNDHIAEHGLNGGVRMGIDDISLVAAPTLGIKVTEGPMNKTLVIDNPSSDTIAVKIYDRDGSMIMKLPSFADAKSIVDLSMLTIGTYELEFSSGERLYTREIDLK